MKGLDEIVLDNARALREAWNAAKHMRYTEAYGGVVKQRPKIRTNPRTGAKVVVYE